MPGVAKHETVYLDMLNRASHHTWVHQYRVLTSANEYYLDFYCPTLNIAVEYDEPYHQNEAQKLKDRFRQAAIENKLGCKFYRYCRINSSNSLAFHLFAKMIINRSESN